MKKKYTYLWPLDALGIAEYLWSNIGILDGLRKGTSAIQGGLFLVPVDQSQASYVEKKNFSLNSLSLFFNALPVGPSFCLTSCSDKPFGKSADIDLYSDCFLPP